MSRQLGWAVAIALLCGAAARAEFTELVVFGDSMSDVGNDLAVLGAPVAPYDNGRFSNGPVWVEQFAAGLGIPVATASENGGTNYAYGGAQNGEGPNSYSPLIRNVAEQIDDYIADGGTPAASQLFVMFSGHNDYLLGGETDATGPVAEMVASITELAGLGATNFLVSTLMPMGQLPLNVGTGAEAVADAYSAQFNSLLLAELPTLRTMLGVTIYELDTGAVIQDMIDNPGAYGFTNVTQGAYNGDYLGSGTVVSNPEDYLFWDTVHPSTLAHGQVAAAALLAVPEPATIALAAFGLAALAVCCWRKR